MAIFPKISIFAQIASLQGAGTFFAIIASPLAIFGKIANFARIASRQGAGTFFAIIAMPSGDFRQNRQSPRGHVWHPTQIVRGWRFFAIFAILAIACISGYKWKWRGILMVRFYYRFL